ncbi:hypothetical protein AB0J72_13950 [Dactylosporangium sp. NPDC049742]|uniref:hypothetical protein n=1 Tax=Dactylosporangium sp. NPDC049742 TaxID=3154737 RepID=UPI00343C6A36
MTDDDLASLLARLPRLTGLEHDRLVVAVEQRGDPAAVRPLLERVAVAPGEALFGLHHALVRLTGHDPVLPLDRDAWPHAVRLVWAAWEPATEARPRVEDVEPLGDDRARLVVADGRGVIGIDYDPTPPGSTWPRWFKSLLVGGSPLYGVGSDCGTCETTLHLIGWPERPAAALSQLMRERLGDVTALDGDVLDAVAPLLTGLRSGHYLAALADLDLELVSDPAASWCMRRHELRVDEEPDEVPPVDWPGTGHLQLRTTVPGVRPTFAVVLPSQDLAAVDPRTVAAHTARIAAGERPTAVVTAWVEDRDVRMDHPERFFVGVVLDGHHKLVAYARHGVPARVLLLCRVEDSWGPPADRTAFLHEALDGMLGIDRGT